MAEWRLARGWTDHELDERLRALAAAGRNFDDPTTELTSAHGWRHYYSEAVIGREEPGPPRADGPFERGKVAVANYQFSDPRIVIGHFDPKVPLQGRRMLLEMRALRFLHYLGGVVVGAKRELDEHDRTVFGYRYDTLEGHIEKGLEWFLLTKDHVSGELRFRIEAAWKPGQFPNWWSRVGFALLGHHYQRTWHRHAHNRLAQLVRDPTVGPPRPRRGRLVHTGPKVIFSRS